MHLGKKIGLKKMDSENLDLEKYYSKNSWIKKTNWC